MSSERNKHGLSRDIPDPVRRLVRQECGFGCVVCGSAYFQYEHIDPPFAHATEHDPKKIACLCGGCHDKVTRGIWSKEKVKEARANPKCRQMGFSWSDFDISPSGLSVSLGSARFIYPRTVLRVFDQDLLTIQGSETPGGPLQVSGRFYNRDSQPIFTIRDNEWTGPVENWDIETVGPKITIRRDQGDIALKLAVLERKHVVVERLDMYFDGVRIVVDEEGVSAGSLEWRIGFRGVIWSPMCCLSVGRDRSVLNSGVGYGIVREGLVFGIGQGSASSRGDIINHTVKRKPDSDGGEGGR